MPPKYSINNIPFLLLRGCLQSEERAKQTSAFDSPAGSNGECTVARQNILPLEPSSISNHDTYAITNSTRDTTQHAIIFVLPVTLELF